MSLLVIAAALLHGSGISGTDTIEGVHAGLAMTLDETAALAFALAFARLRPGVLPGRHLRRTGGDAGYLRRSIPLVARRSLTLAPALLVLALGIDPTRALLLSQVVLSFGIPFALVPLVLLTRRGDIMSDLVNRRVTTVTAALAAG